MRIALIASVCVVIYTGFFPSAALELARDSVQGLSVMGGVIPGLGQ